MVLGRDNLGSGAVAPAEYFIQLFRRRGLHTNDRQLVLSSEEQMVAMQLCLAEKNKKVYNRALCRTKLLPVTHVLVDTWMLTVKPIYKR